MSLVKQTVVMPKYEIGQEFWRMQNNRAVKVTVTKINISMSRDSETDTIAYVEKYIVANAYAQYEHTVNGMADLFNSKEELLASL